MSKKISVRRAKVWSKTNVIQVCNKNEWYTDGDNESFDNMLDYVEKHQHNITVGDLYWVAQDIACHSDMTVDNYTIGIIMTDLENHTIYTIYSLLERDIEGVSGFEVIIAEE